MGPLQQPDQFQVFWFFFLLGVAFLAAEPHLLFSIFQSASWSTLIGVPAGIRPAPATIGDVAAGPVDHSPNSRRVAALIMPSPHLLLRAVWRLDQPPSLVNLRARNQRSRQHLQSTLPYGAARTRRPGRWLAIAAIGSFFRRHCRHTLRFAAVGPPLARHLALKVGGSPEYFLSFLSRLS